MPPVEDDDMIQRKEPSQYDETLKSKYSYSAKDDIMPRALAKTMIVGGLLGIAFWIVVAFLIIRHYR